jgi:hypothetical protein
MLQFTVQKEYTTQDAEKGRPARPQRVKIRGVPLGYVEPLSDARTPLEDFFSILLDEGAYQWHTHAISVTNAANPAITSVTPITRPSGSSSPTSNQSEH